jgi:hypothetical protein
MSDNAVVFLDLATDATEAPRRIAHLKALLLEAAIIVPNSQKNIWQPSEYLPGPRAIEVAPHFALDHIRQLASNGIDFIATRESYPQSECDPPPPSIV